ncbi:MAG: YopX family protein [Roseburia inulinivorans]
MENRYLFRAKRIDNGEWVEGYLSYPSCTEKGNESYYFYAKDSLDFFSRCVVDASTVCQCTGRNDKNGKLIYENDIMVAYYDEENPVMVVWRECGFVAVENNSDELCPLDYFTQKHFYVVGNIFDNPELLEV